MVITKLCFFILKKAIISAEDRECVRSLFLLFAANGSLSSLFSMSSRSQPISSSPALLLEKIISSSRGAQKERKVLFTCSARGRNSLFSAHRSIFTMWKSIVELFQKRVRNFLFYIMCKVCWLLRNGNALAAQMKFYWGSSSGKTSKQLGNFVSLDA